MGLRDAFADLPDDARLTLTWDQGSEMAGHDQIATLFRDGVFFAHAGKPWQRPTNENTYWYKMAGPEAPSTGVALVRATG